jgi:predicted nuclease of predicted toxin-antitoxin system
MRILLDENLPLRLTAALRALGHDVEHVYTRDLSGRPDPDVRAVAEAEDRLLITQDIRFADARVFAPGAHAGLLLVRLKSPGRTALFEKVRRVFETEDVEAWRGCFVVLSDAKLRVRRPAV